MNKVTIAICLLLAYLFIGSFLEFKECAHITAYYICGACLLAIYCFLVLGKEISQIEREIIHDPLTIKKIKLVAVCIKSALPNSCFAVIQPLLALRCVQKCSSNINVGEIAHVDMFDHEKVHLVERSTWELPQYFEIVK